MYTLRATSWRHDSLASMHRAKECDTASGPHAFASQRELTLRPVPAFPLELSRHLLFILFMCRAVQLDAAAGTRTYLPGGCDGAIWQMRHDCHVVVPQPRLIVWRHCAALAVHRPVRAAYARVQGFRVQDAGRIPVHPPASTKATCDAACCTLMNPTDTSSGRAQQGTSSNRARRFALIQTA